MLARATGILIATVLSCVVAAGAASPALAVSSADLTATLSDSVAGQTTLGTPWTWTVHIANNPAGSPAAFASGQTILSDDLEQSGNVTFGTPTVQGQNIVTGQVACAIASNTLSCTANGAVTVWGGGSFDVTVSAEPSVAGTFSNPRLFGDCEVDPDNKINESNEGNNLCDGDSIFVSAPDLSVSQSDDVSGQIDQGGNWKWRLSVANTGDAAANFATGATIIQDQLDNSFSLRYGTPTIENATGVTNAGAIQCAIDSGKTLTCTANGSPVTVGAGTGAFDVLIPATPTANAEYTSPRISGICQVDPANVIDESNEANNDCGTDVVDTYSPVDLGVTDVGSPDPTVVAGSGGGVDNLTHTITLTNHGPEATTGAEVFFPVDFGLPDGVTISSASASDGSYDQGTGIWTVGALANNASATLTITFSVTSAAADGATVTTDATVNNAEQFINDHDSTNDSATVSTTVSASGVQQTVFVSPASKDFGSQRVNTTSTAQRFTVTNRGSSTLNITTAALTGANPGEYVESNDTCSGAHVAASGTCTVDVAFRPDGTAPQPAALEITSDAPSSPTNVVLHGTGTESVVSASPSSWTFGSQTLGTTSGTQSFQITNTGTTTLHISIAALAGLDASQYEEPTDTCSSTAVPAGQSCTATVAFKPTSTGTHNNASLDITSDDASGVFHIALSGSGVAPIATATPTSKSFGNQPINSTSNAQTIQIKNTGNAELAISNIALAGTDSDQYSLSNNTCTDSVDPLKTCSVDVAFSPTTTGSHNAATLDITSNDPTGVDQVALSGTGVLSPVTLTPASNNFGKQHVGTTGPTQMFTVTNTGNSPLTITSIALAGPDAAQFATPNDSCTGVQLAMNASCQVGVAFAPTTPGAHNGATLDVTNDGPSGVDQITLSGTGILGAISPSITSHDFGSQRVDTTSAAQRVTITNTGSDTLTITSAALAGTDAGQYIASSNNCEHAQLSAGSKCSVDIAFGPTSTGSHSDARLDVTSDAGTSVVHITFTGTGSQPSVTPSLSARDFGAQRVGTTSASQVFTITNSGLGALNVRSVSLIGSDAGQYLIPADRCSGQSVVAGQACTIEVAFAPSGMGGHPATLTILTDARGSPTQVSLNGTGTQPTIALGPTRRDFGSVTLGTSSSPVTFTVSNTGSASTTISGTSVVGADAGQFPRSADHCAGRSLAPGGTCTVQVSFHPTSPGVHNRASLAVASDAGTVSAALTARAAAPSNAFTIGHLKIRSNGTAQFDVTVHAAGALSAVTSAPKVSVFGQTRMRTGRAGTVHVTVTPNSAGRKLVKHHHGRLRIQLSVGFTPTFGTARKQTLHGLFVAK